jgi:hypothetical protein
MSANPIPDAAPKARNMFVLRPLKSVTIGKATVKLYPIVTSSMQPPERAHAFQVNKITPLPCLASTGAPCLTPLALS